MGGEKVEEAEATLAGVGTVQARAVRIINVEAGFPPANLPTFFADGIASAAPSESVVRFYLYRSDPEQLGTPDYKNQVIAQIVMPIPSFLHASLFFEKAVKHFVSEGAISAEMVESLRQREGL